MDRHTAEPEDLPGLQLTVLRELDLAQGAPDRPPHVSSASGVARRGDHVYVIGDDQLDLAVFRLSRGDPGELRKALSGELADDPAADKPDLEALTLLPPFEGSPYGALLGLPSGSKPDRDRGFVWRLAADGALEGDPVELDLGPVYALVGEQVGALNVEGAATLGDRLWLFNRGNLDAGRNAVAEIPLARLVESILGDHRLDCDELAAIRFYELGELEGVPLSFSDATPVADELIVFTASAEDEDGKIRGSVVGTVDAGGAVERLRTIDRQWKVEGVYAAVDARVIDFLFVCDQDDPETASPLLSASMPVEARYESRA